jgi:dTDP-4-dehydrorhamnose reductase
MWLLVGGDSEIGAATHQFLKSRGIASAATTQRKELVAADRPFLDLSSPLDNWEPPHGTRGACIFAAVARLADCAADPAGSAHINVTQTLALIERLVDRGIHVIFLSTNQIFDGNIPNVPADALPCPVSEYGHQKARTEAALHRFIGKGASIAILRLAKVVSPHIALVHKWIAMLSAGKPIRAFSDMTMAPTPTVMVSAAISALLEDQARGIYQLTGPRDVAYDEIGRFIAGRLGVDPALVKSTNALADGLPNGATPRHTTLDSSLMRERYGLVVPDVWPVVEMVMDSSMLHAQR